MKIFTHIDTITTRKTAQFQGNNIQQLGITNSKLVLRLGFFVYRSKKLYTDFLSGKRLGYFVDRTRGSVLH